MTDTVAVRTSVVAWGADKACLAVAAAVVVHRMRFACSPSSDYLVPFVACVIVAAHAAAVAEG